MPVLIYGAVGALLVFLLLFAGFLLGWTARKYLPDANSARRSVPAEPPRQELAEIEKERRRIMQEQRAFATMMGYNPDVAYGLSNGQEDMTKRE